MTERRSTDPYTTVKLPKEFGELIDEIVGLKRYGFTSRADVVKVAVREYYEKIKRMLANEQSE